MKKIHEMKISELPDIWDSEYPEVTLKEWAIAKVKNCKGLNVQNIWTKDGKDTCVLKVFYACFKGNRCPKCQSKMEEYELTEKDLK